jgi:stage V sporulation protein S
MTLDSLRISSQSDPGSVAGAIANGIRESGEADINAIGPRAVNQAIKAIAIARSYVAASGVDLYFVPSFTCVRMAEETDGKTAMHLAIRSRHEMTGGTDSRQTRVSTTEES